LNTTLNIFAVDDHEAILNGYKFMFENIEHTYENLTFTKALDCKSAYDVIKQNTEFPFNIALVDYSIPPYPKKNLESGHDIAVMLRKKMPGCKIVMLTMHREAGILNKILLSVNPDAFINKSDCNVEELSNAFTKVLNGTTYHSKTIQNYLTRREQGVTLEDIDLSIITLLAKGVKNKHLSKYIPLTDSTIEKRKHKIKKLLKVDGDDNELITVAKSQGYI
jgi:two-component system response regulator NreC